MRKSHIWALYALMVTLLTPGIAWAGIEDGAFVFVIKLAMRFLRDNLVPASRPLYLSIIFATVTASWMFPSKIGRKIAKVMGPIGLMVFIIFNLWSIIKFGWSAMWSAGVLWGIVFFIILWKLAPGIITAAPGWFKGKVSQAIDHTKAMAGEKGKGVKEESWGWVIIGGVSAIGFINSGYVNKALSNAPIYFTCGASVIFWSYAIRHYSQKKFWPWQEGRTRPDTPEPNQPEPQPDAPTTPSPQPDPATPLVTPPAPVVAPVATITVCPRCNTQQSAGQFCGKCGILLTSQAPSVSPQTSRQVTAEVPDTWDEDDLYNN